MNLKSLLFWSSVLTLPTLFLLKKKPGVVEPGPEGDAGEGEVIVLEPSEPPLPFSPEHEPTMPADFKNFVQPSMPGYARMASASVPAAAMPLLRPLLALPLGTVTRLPLPGRDINAVIEPHYHPPGGATKPWGWHKGVSLWEKKGQVA